jgi:hypothetical protein
VIILPNLGLHFADGLILVDVDECLPLDSQAWGADDQEEAAIREAAVRDLARLKSGWRPGARAIAQAPVLTNWTIAEPAPGIACFWGQVTGHPNFPAGRYVQTSFIVALDSHELIWARTLSRFYRLSTPVIPPDRRRYS